MEKLEGAGSRDPEPATERDARLPPATERDAKLPEQWDWPLQQALYCKRNETQPDSTSSQSATDLSDPALPTKRLVEHQNISNHSNSCFLSRVEK